MIKSLVIGLLFVVLGFAMELQAEDKYAENDVIVIQYSASWCGPCKSLKQTLKNNVLIDAIKEKTKGWFHIDIEADDVKSTQWTEKGNPTVVPTVVKFKRIGNRWVEQKRFTGSRNVDFIKNWLMAE